MKVLLLVYLITIYERVFGWLSGVEIIGEEKLPSTPFIYAFWHRYIFLLTYSHRGRGITVLASTSRDGRVAAGVVKKLGFNIISGTASSPTTGVRALIKLKATLNSQGIAAIAADGPRGPAFEVKKGLPFLAIKTGYPIVPLAAAVKKRKSLNSWDRFLLPVLFPFNKMTVLSGRPVYVGQNENIDDAAGKIKKELDEISSKADNLL